MSQLFNTGIMVSRGNSTTIPLIANTTFTGATEDVTSYEEIDVNVAGSPSNAPGSLYFEFSPDGINWDVSIWISGAPLPGPTVTPQCLRVVLPYFRVIYINGSVNQTEFRLTVVYHRSSGTRLTRYLNQPVDFTEPVENVQAFMAAKNADGGFSHINLTAAGALEMDGSAVIQPIKITDGYHDGYCVSVTPPNTPATAAESALVVAISPNNSFTVNSPKPSTVITSNVAASVTNITLLQSNTNRLGASIYNDSSSGFLYINLNASADSSDFVIKLFPLGYYEIPFGYVGEINGAWSSTDGIARVAEFTP